MQKVSDTNNLMTQSKLEENTGTFVADSKHGKTYANKSQLVLVSSLIWMKTWLFCFTSDWMKKWRE